LEYRTGGDRELFALPVRSVLTPHFERLADVRS
jgi:hypothetical protein